MKKIIHEINDKFAELSGWILFVIMFLILFDIVTRVINKPIQGITELAVISMMVVVYLGLAHCEENKEHVSVDALIKRLPLKKATIINLFTYLLQLVVMFFIFYAVSRDAVIAYTTKQCASGANPIILWPVKFFMSIGLLFYWIQILKNFLIEFRKIQKY